MGNIFRLMLSSEPKDSWTQDIYMKINIYFIIYHTKNTCPHVFMILQVIIITTTDTTLIKAT